MTNGDAESKCPECGFDCLKEIETRDIYFNDDPKEENFIARRTYWHCRCCGLKWAEDEKN